MQVKRIVKKFFRAGLSEKSLSEKINRCVTYEVCPKSNPDDNTPGYSSRIVPFQTSQIFMSRSKTLPFSWNK